MSNRLKPEQFGKPAKPSKSVRMDELMERSLANVCKDWIAEGKGKEDVVKWISRRFDENGDLHLRQVATKIMRRNMVTHKDIEFYFVSGQVFSVDAEALYTVSLLMQDVLMNETDSSSIRGVHTENTLGFMLALTDYEHYVIWRMGYATEDSTETMIMGGCLDMDNDIESGAYEAKCIPLPVLGSVLELMVNLKVLNYTADMIG
jgi:hypothetical protein